MPLASSHWMTPFFPYDDADELELERWKLWIRRIDERRAVQDEVTKEVFAIVKGQCSPTMVDRIEASHDWNTILQQHNLIALLNLIGRSLYSSAITWNPIHALRDAYNRYQSFRQGTQMSNSNYLCEFKALVTTVQQLGGELGMEASRVREQLDNNETVMDADNPSEAEQTRACNAAREAFLAVDFLAKSNMKCFGSLLAELENLYTQGVDGYHITLASSFDMVVNYKDPSKYRAPARNENEDRMSFFNNQDEQDGQCTPQGRGYSGRGGTGRGRRGSRGRGSGRGCGQHGEQGSNFYQALDDDDDSQCSEPAEVEYNSNEQVSPYSHCVESHIHYSPSKPFDAETPERWLMIDSCSTLNLISNKSWLSNIHEVDMTMHIHSIGGGGVSVTRKMGYLGNYPTPVWYLPDGNANILSLRDVTRHYRVTMDVAVENAIILHGADKQQHRFIPSGKGLYKWEHTMDPTANNPCWLFVTTICDQADCYTRHAYEHAQAAQWLQNIIMRPASRHMSDIAISHLHNCPFTKEDIQAADDIFRLNLGSLKGKTVWHPSKHVQAATSGVPQCILKLHRDMVLSMDIVFVNKLLFLVTTSCNLRFSMVESLPNGQVGTVTMCLKKVI